MSRLDRITTRIGDDGSTRLGDGSVVQKSHARIDCLGSVDELNSSLGLLLSIRMGAIKWQTPVFNLPSSDCISQRGRASFEALFTHVQHRLFELGGELAIPGTRRIEPADVEGLEAVLESLNQSLPPLEEFILPGGTETAARAQVARAVCRRAERSLVRLREAEGEAAVNPDSLCYLNRLSDLLFVTARALNRHAGVADVCWKRKISPMPLPIKLRTPNRSDADRLFRMLTSRFVGISVLIAMLIGGIFLRV